MRMTRRRLASRWCHLVAAAQAAMVPSAQASCIGWIRAPPAFWWWPKQTPRTWAWHSRRAAGAPLLLLLHFPWLGCCRHSRGEEAGRRPAVVATRFSAPKAKAQAACNSLYLCVRQAEGQRCPCRCARSSAALPIAPVCGAHHTPAPTPRAQFKDRTVSRTYVSIALGVPRPPEGRVATNVGRCASRRGGRLWVGVPGGGTGISGSHGRHVLGPRMPRQSAVTRSPPGSKSVRAFVCLLLVHLLPPCRDASSANAPPAVPVCMPTAASCLFTPHALRTSCPYRCRDLRDRKKMAAFAYASTRGRTAASNYKLLEVLAGGGASLVQWRLETGRTHQVRAAAGSCVPQGGEQALGGVRWAGRNLARRLVLAQAALSGRKAHPATLLTKALCRLETDTLPGPPAMPLSRALADSGAREAHRAPAVCR